MKKYSLSECIIEFKKIHNDKYNYSKVQYVNMRTKIIIICNTHGEFLQTPQVHIKGSGCKLCGYLNSGLKQSKSYSDFLIKAKSIHGDKYIYSNENYKNLNTPINIKCSVHGWFMQKPILHLQKSGCPHCAGNILKTHEQFLEKANKIHNSKYLYLDTYKNNKTKIKIKCFQHGLFLQKPFNHLSDDGCPHCAGNVLKTHEQFLNEARNIHGDRYLYLENYISSKKKIKILCKEHGEFKQTPQRHLQGGGCQNCAGNQLKTHNQFLIDSLKIHGDKYKYPEQYINDLTPINIDCNIHGIFKQKPNRHLQGNGCPFCKESKGEKYISNYLNNHHIKYLRQYKFADCKNQMPLPFDFYLPEKNLCIEFDGRQHFMPIKSWGGLDGFKKTKKNDEIKNQYCYNNGIELIRINYLDIKNIDNILNNKIVR